MVTSREETPHQRAGDDGRDFCQGEPRCASPPQDGQYHSGVVREPSRRDSLLDPGPESKGSLALVPGQKNHPLSGVSPRREKLHSRLPVKSDIRLSGVETGPGGVHGADPEVRQVQSGPICNSLEHTTAPVHSVEARPLRNGDGCSLNLMVRFRRVCIPSLQSHREVSTQVGNGAVHCPAGSPSVASSTMVSAHPGVSGRLTDSSPIIPDSSARSIRTTSPPATVQLPPASRLESFRGKLSADGVSQQATELISAGWSKGTNCAYQSAWSRWRSWCLQRNIDPFSSNVSTLANFLASLFNQGLQHRSINTIRSAISVTHNNIDGIPMGQHPLITHLMKGIYNSRPPQPKYSSSWSVARVTDYLKNLGPNHGLSLKQLTLKLVVLMALVEASRSSELAALDLRFRVFTPEGVTFSLPTLTKKRKAGAPPRKLFFGGYPPDERLCHPLLETRSAPLRKNRAPDLPDKLFLSYIQPHKFVGAQRVANWIKVMLKEAGVDTGTFSAHSTRGASATAAARQGVSTANILEAADWSTEDTFRRFYYRPGNNPAFAHGVLSDSSHPGDH